MLCTVEWIGRAREQETDHGEVGVDDGKVEREEPGEAVGLVDI